jgi:DNA-binding SARP family transcriptional activator
MLGTTRMHQGELARARTLFRESLAALRLDPQYLFLARGLEMLGSVAHESGETEAAVPLIASGAAVRNRIGAGMFKIDRQTLEPRLEALRQALGPARFAALWAEGERLGPLEALEKGLEWAQGDLPPAIRLVPDPRPTPPAPIARGSTAAPAELEVRALGPLHVSRRGEEIDAAGWTSARPRELLLYLLCHPRGRTREQVGLVFWPDSSAPQVKNSFHVLVHRLRKAIGDPDLVLLEGDRYRINPQLDVRFDAESFEAGITAALREGDGPAAVRRLEEALAIYRGDFLEEEVVGDWHLEIHDRLRRLYVDGLSRLAELQIAGGDPARAAATLEALVEKEDLREDAHRRLMECYVAGGERDRALRHYESFVTLLREELDAAPEAATVELAARIRAPAPLPEM